MESLCVVHSLTLPVVESETIITALYSSQSCTEANTGSRGRVWISSP